MIKTKKRYEMVFDLMIDKDIIEKLESIPSQRKADYIRSLIRKDIKKSSRK